MINQVARGPWLRKPADERIEDTFAQPSRHPSVRVPDPYAEVAPVAAEELITAKAGQRYLDEAGCRLTHVIAWNQDRKSTRLNSSHSQISYAVFCLKKKKKNNIDNQISRLIS